MEAPAGTPSAPYTAYGLRLDSDSRWQLIEPLPTDQRALEAELQRLDAKLGALDNGSEPDLVKGCGILETRRHALEAQARARFDRLEASVSMLYEHECDQAKARYAARCEQLKLDMGKEIQREIQRLRRARDGVAVMDRRRLKRNSGNNNNSSSTANGAGGGGDAGDANGINDGYSSGGNPVTEKRRMEVLLSAAPIFRRLDKTLASDDVASDMASIKETMPTFLCQDGDGMDDDDDDDDDVETDDEEARELDEIRDLIGGGFKRRRLNYNADRVPEGQHVVVYRTSAKKTSHGTTAGKSRSRASRDDGDSPRRELMTGVITAATSTQVYLLTTDGSFQHIPVDDWKTGRVTVHTVATPDEQ